MLSGRKILVLEDETFLRKSLCNYLESKGADTFAADSLAEARHVMEGGELDFALLDVNLPDGNGMDLLQDPGFPSTTRVVIMTADGGIRTAIEAMKKGASDYLSKPFDPDELPMVFTSIEREAVHNRIKEHEEVSRLKTSESLFTGQRMQAVRGQLEKILKADQRLATGLPPVLIEGETGTGKSTIARWLHENGPRRASPLIEINCSTLPDSLAESELFGHERGAFTDARKERIGLFEAADGGSLFLDEIASLSPAIQAKVLTAVEDGRIRRVGGNTLRRVDVRLIAASLHPLEKLVREGTFREDLYHRLNLLHVRIPPLRDFPQDIPALAGHLLESLKKRYRLPGVTVSEAGTASLIAHSWPGNVRELIHELERALIFSEGKAIEFPQLQPGPGSEHGTAGNSLLLNPMWQIPEGDYHFEEALQALVQAVIDRALEQEKGNVSAAARRLGVSRDFIRYRRNS